MKTKAILTAIGLAGAGVLSAAPLNSAATLNVELTVSHGIESPMGAQGAKGRRVAYFVIDRSGSMAEATLAGGRTPNDALLESLKMRLDSLPNGTSVYVIPFASFIKSTQVYEALDAKKRAQIYDFVKNDKPDGYTLLYDAQDIALTEAGRTMQRDPAAEVSVYVYTDGLHETPSNYRGDYPASCYKRVGRKWVQNDAYRREVNDAYVKFKKKWADLVAKPTLELEYEWLSASTKPDPEKWVDKPNLATELKSRVSELKNPCAEPEQTIACQLFLPISDSCWKEVSSKKMLLHLEVDGRTSSTQVSLKDGIYKIDWPALPSDHSAMARLVFSHMPEGKKFKLKDTKPLVLNVPAQGQTPFSVVSPPAGAVYPLDANVVFSAKASEGVDVEWSIAGGKGGVLRGLSANWKATTPGRFGYRATARKQRCRDASEDGTFEVIPTGVEIVSATDRHEVGKESEFRAKAVGQCQGYAWKIDGTSVPGGTGDKIKYLFKKPGRHVIGVTARYKAGIMTDAKELEISVSKAPFLEILQPKAFGGDPEFAQYQAEKPVKLLATVDGDLTKVQWQFQLKGKAVLSVPSDVKDGLASGSFVPPKGGLYDLTVTAEGPAGKKVEKIQTFVKSTEVGVTIKKPVANDEVETGKPFELSAETKGPVKSVRWKMVDKSTAQTITFGPSEVSEVINGTSTIKAKLPQELGTTSVEITAEPVPAVEDNELAETAETSTITVLAKTHAGIVYTRETLENNFRWVKYGSQVALAVSTSGAIGKVAWFTLDEKGNEKGVGMGPSINVSKEVVYGQRECHVDYFAKGLMPDGKTWVEARKGESSVEPITVFWYCPRIEPKIVLPNNEADFGIDEEIVFKVISGNKDCGELTDNDVAKISWDFGDGTVVTNNHVSTKHVFRKLSDGVTVSVQTVCKKCGEIEAVDITRPVVCSCVCAEIFSPGSNSVVYAGEPTEFRLRNSRTKTELSGNDFKSVCWSANDGGRNISGMGEFLSHEFSEMGETMIKADMVCKHCGKKSAAAITRKVKNRPISLAFKFNPDGNVFRPGSTIKFLDESTGRVKGRKWFVDGVAVKDDGREIPFQLPVTPCEYKVNLAVCDSEGLDFLNGVTNVVQLDEIAESGYLDKEREELVRGVYYHSSHVKEFKGRWGGVAALIALLVAFIFWWGIWKIFHGNEPRGWTVQFSFCNEEDALTPDARRLNRVVRSGTYDDLKTPWSWWHKKAEVPVRNIAAVSGMKAASWALLPEDCTLEFTQSSSAKQAFVKGKSQYLARKPREYPEDLKGRTFLFRKIFGRRDEFEYMFVFVDGVRPSVATRYFLYIILPLALLGLSYFAMTRVAF